MKIGSIIYFILTLITLISSSYYFYLIYVRHHESENIYLVSGIFNVILFFFCLFLWIREITRKEKSETK